MSLAQALFAPRSVALVGASGDAAKNTARPQRYLRKHGYPGKLFPVNPTRKEILGEKAYARVSDIAETVDHAYILIEDVEQALEDCGRRGVPVASVFSDLSTRDSSSPCSCSGGRGTGSRRKSSTFTPRRAIPRVSPSIHFCDAGASIIRAKHRRFTYREARTRSTC